MSYETIAVERIEDVLKITLNRPDRLNAAPPQMAVEISDCLGDLGSARAVLLTGAGRAFCSGADLVAGVETHLVGGSRSYKVLSQAYNPVIAQLARLEVPVVTAVNGPAAGIGCALALAGDFVLAGKNSYFLQAFANIGLVPDGGSTWTLPRLVGRTRALEMMMLAERIPAEKAQEWGLIYKWVDDADLMAEAMDLAQRLARGPTVAFGLLRRLVAQGQGAGLDASLVAEAEAQRSAANSADASEGKAAFLEKRKASFTGN
ncbi:enoyl-CoA hydratase-related protein [Novosphingobium sp. KCTC 2891]|uniref:enoyl-CoA hydratase-related protein n=1 Tax=Novosphingobium sp. KCTC 2891 TaxID=2989730 RepID=UPI002222AB27|nr:enoyl-CoA hydratase-related protein [Novosphingobium sp. KCTC 2891]MCW1385014.1 enoyl-CoA hydratase-related protein [Novosphingobium sp. KCTC 2891]